MRARAFAFAAILAPALAWAAAPKLEPGRLNIQFFENARGERLPYALFVPEGYDPARKYPLVIDFHGNGGQGDDLETIQRKWQRENYVFTRPDSQAKHPVFFLRPRCPRGQKWVDVSWSRGSHAQPAEPTRGMRMTLEIVDFVLEEFSVDRGRVYANGGSMGGYAVFDILARRPGFFAAAVAVAGGGDPSKARLMADVPLWVFHGERDGIVPVSGSRDMVEAIRSAGGTVRYDELKGVGHDGRCWNAAWSGNAELLPWLYSKRRKLPERPASKEESPGSRVREGRAEAAADPTPAPDEETLAAWDARLIERARRSVEAGRRPRFRLESMRATVSVVSVGREGVLAVTVSGMRMRVPWSRLTLAEKRNLALSCVRPGEPADHALAAFYLLALAERAEAARHLARAGEDTDTVRKAFE
jgi:poly(3-hydroxybutyrate) depolymerase